MDNLTKERKIELYKDALSRYQLYLKIGRKVGLCHAMNMVRAYGEPSPYNELDMQEHYPELYAYYPPEKKFSSDYWWPITHRAIRVKVLTDIIEKLEAE